MGQQRIYRILRRLVDGVLASSGRDAVWHWLGGHKEDAVTDGALFRIWNGTDGSGVSEKETLAALDSVKERLGLHDSTRVWRMERMRTVWRYAAVILLPLLTGMAVWHVMDRRVETVSEMAECYVPQGQQKKIRLSDGTEVTLNSETLFVYPKNFYGKRREVYLSGEAFFDVTHDEKKPFIVQAGPLDVRVLGTTFNVEAYMDDDLITTTLETGRVKVYRSDNESDGVTMEPDERVVYHKQNGSFEVFRTDAEKTISWTEGEIRFVNQPLSAILKTLERRYDVTFRYDTHIGIGEIYTMKFKSDETIGEVMRVLALAAGDMEYSIEGNIIFLRSVKKGGETH